MRGDLRDAAPGRAWPVSPTFGRSRSRRGPAARSSRRPDGSRPLARALGVRSLDRAAATDRLGLDDTDRATMSRRSAGVSALERVEALLANPALYELADLDPRRRPDAGGRRRDYPTFMWLLYEALISVYGSARRVEAELAHPLVWDLIRTTVRRALPDRRRPAPAGPADAPPPLPLRPQPLPHRPRRPRRSSRDRTANSPPTRPASSGSSTRTVPARGPIPTSAACSTPTAKSSPPSSRPSPATNASTATTGELRPTRVRTRRGAALRRRRQRRMGHQVRPRRRAHRPRPRPHHPRRRMGPHPRRRSPHRHRLLHPPRTPHPGRAGRHLRHRTARRPPPAPAARTRPAAHQPGHRRQSRRRASRAATTGDASRRASTSKTRPSPSPTAPTRTIALYALGGALGIGELTDTGEPHFVALARIRTHRNRDKNGRYRWYNDYQLPDQLRRPDHHRPAPRQRRRHRPQAQPHREPPAHPARRPRLRTALPPPQRRRIHQPPPRRHPVARPRPQHRPRPPAPQPPRLRPHRQLARARTATDDTRRRHSPRRPPDAAGQRERPTRAERAERSRSRPRRPPQRAQTSAANSPAPSILGSPARGFLPPIAPAPPP